ncbi:MAG: ribosome biogenesis GTPase Der [Spirochaetota bacterium]
MNALPIVTIVGRQNVGKSTLFNKIYKKNIAITHDYPGVTRDILKVAVERQDIQSAFHLCDSPGLDIENVDDLNQSIIEVSFQQLLDSHLIIFVMDRNEVTAYDHRLIDLFHKDPRFHAIPIIYCINKSDKVEDDADLEYFYRQGIQEVLPISALGRRNLKLLYEKINFYLKSYKGKSKVNADLSVSIVGKPNSGKSSVLNAFLGYQRAVVSQIAGTTRDSVNSYFQYKGKTIEIVDTAGIRKQSKNSKDKLEFLSFNRTIKSLDSSDVIIHLIDANKGIGDYDKKILSTIKAKGKPIVLAVNKWDLLENKDSNTFKNYRQKLTDRLFALKEIPIISISAKEKQRLFRVLDECLVLQEKSQRKVSTAALNRKLKEWMENTKIASSVKNPPKLLYATQVSSSPFKVICFVNHVSSFRANILTYLKKQMVQEFSLQGITVELELRSDRRQKA